MPCWEWSIESPLFLCFCVYCSRDDFTLAPYIQAYTLLLPLDEAPLSLCNGLLCFMLHFFFSLKVYFVWCTHSQLCSVRINLSTCWIDMCLRDLQNIFLGLSEAIIREDWIEGDQLRGRTLWMWAEPINGLGPHGHKVEEKEDSQHAQLSSS